MHAAIKAAMNNRILRRSFMLVTNKVFRIERRGVALKAFPVADVGVKILDVGVTTNK